METKISLSMLKYWTKMIAEGKRDQALNWAESYRAYNQEFVDALMRLPTERLKALPQDIPLPSKECFMRLYGIKG